MISMFMSGVLTIDGFVPSDLLKPLTLFKVLSNVRDALLNTQQIVSDIGTQRLEHIRAILIYQYSPFLDQGQSSDEVPLPRWSAGYVGGMSSSQDSLVISQNRSPPKTQLGRDARDYRRHCNQPRGYSRSKDLAKTHLQLSILQYIPYFSNLTNKNMDSDIIYDKNMYTHTFRLVLNESFISFFFRIKITQRSKQKLRSLSFTTKLHQIR